MAVEIEGLEVDFMVWGQFSRDGVVGVLDVEWWYPYPLGDSTQYVVNKVWDTVAGEWVPWDTKEIDDTGKEYPGPGVFGVDTEGYRVETIKFTRV